MGSTTPPPGLCASCAQAQVITSSRGSTFYFCHLSLSDPTFARYPRIPVRECPGYSRRADTDEEEQR